MFNLILHKIVYGLFEVYLFCAYWLARITFVDRLFERFVLHFAKKARIRIVLAYKQKGEKVTSNGHDEINMMNGDAEDKWPTVTVHDRRAFAKVLAYPTVGLGDTFIDGWIDGSEDGLDLSGFWERMFEYEYDYFLCRWHFMFRLWNWLLFDCINNQTKSGVKRLMKVHYDLGNDAFERLLGPTMQYTCAYWRNANNIDEAQTAKMDLIARKLKLQPGMRVLDVGCGWGSLANYLSTNYDVHVTAVTPSTEGVRFLKEKFKDNVRVDAVCADYRDMKDLGVFDRITGIGVFEHVGHKNYRSFLDICRKHLKDDGILLLHFIAANQEKPYYPRTERYIDKYVWPCGELPYQTDFVNAVQHRFVIEDCHNFGPDYWKTCDAWFQNWIVHKDYIVAKYGIKTYRCFFGWLRSTVAFKHRRWHLWQIVLSKKGLAGGYESVR